MAEQPAGEKTEEATPRKRQEARKKGTVAKSSDLAGAASLLVCALMLPNVISTLGTGMYDAMHSSMLDPTKPLDYARLMGLFTSFLYPAFISLGPLILCLMAVGLIVNFAQVGFVLSGESMKPTFEKINPLAGFKRLFSIRTTFEGIKAVLKMFLFMWISYAVVAGQWADLSNLSYLPPSQAASKIGLVMHAILVRVAAVWLVLAVADYIFQRKQIDKQLRMTKDELKREMKEQEGSPEVKAAIFHRRRKLLKGGLVTRMREADVVVTNPTHYAIALKYKRNEHHAPMVIAKGQDYLALKIREIADQEHIPIVENPPLARALYKQCEVGDFIPRDMFAAVAEVLAYVYKSVKTAKKTKVGAGV